MAPKRALEVVRDVVPESRGRARRYADPVDEIWLGAARSVGLRVERSEAAFAAYDGGGTLTIGTRATLDADDSFAQLVFHELCHALVAGPDATRALDWGLGRDEGGDLVREHACQRIQAALAGAYGLRAFMAPTTEHRAYYEALPADPLAATPDPAMPASAMEDPAAALAREAWRVAKGGAWLAAIGSALAATSRVALAAAPFAEEGSLWHGVVPPHPSGFARHADATRTCESCAWLFRGGPGRPVSRCRQTSTDPRAVARRVAPSEAACVRWEPRLDASRCGECGACCHAGYDLAPVRPREPIARRHPELVQRNGFGLFLPRPGGRCVALDGSGRPGEPYRCRVYADRPRACADFPVGGSECLVARRRVGLSA